MKKTIIILSVCILPHLAVNAQPAEGSPGGSPTPFGGLELLIAAGAAFGGKKAFDRYKKSKE